LGASLLVIGGPQAAFWARQVMLDIPAYAALVTGIFFFVRYLREERPGYLYLAVFAILAAIYIKINAVFMAPVLAIVLLAVEGRRAFNRHHIIAGTLGVLGLVPIVLLTVAFGETNIQSVAGRPSDLPLASVAAWLFYAEAMPQYLGYTALILGVGGFVLVALRRTRPLEPWLAGLLVGWLGLGYVFFSAISVREPRHGLMIAFPLVLFALLVLHRSYPRDWRRLRR
jgi:4-amino-4-deoxy-L-arabinose transferase-like glycosyltransferase